MEPRTTNCPTPDTLRAFALGQLEDKDAGAVAAHLDSCDACRQAATSQGGDSITRRLRAAQPSGDTRGPSSPGESIPATAAPGLDSGATAPYTGVLPGLPAELADHPTYRVERELGRGGMGVVYLARNKMLERMEVLKVMQEGLAGREGLVQRFIKETQAAARVQHPNIATAYAALPLGGGLMLAMEYVEGLSLAELVKRKGPLPVAHACYYARQVALGLQRAHEHEMVHRDIKPQNLMVTRRGEVKILDFGLAKVKSEQGDSGLTGTGAMMGTPDYMPPEQATDAKNADIRADIYSLGCTLYCLLAGKPPFAGRSSFEVMQAHQVQAPRPLGELRPEVPAELAELVERMLAKKPEGRPQVPMEVAKALLPFCRAPEKGEKVEENTGPVAAVKPPTEVREGRSMPPLTVPARPRAEPEEAVAADEKAPANEEPPRPREGGMTTGKRRSPAAEPAARRMWPLVVGVALSGLAVGLVAIWASGAFKVGPEVKPKDGTVVLQGLQAGAEVLVDGEKATVTWNDDGKTAEISLAPGARKLEVKKDGHTTKGHEVVVEGGGHIVLSVRLEPVKPPPVSADDKGWSRLFNGKDLTGWKTHRTDKAKWEVKDGTLIGSGGRGHLFNVGTSYENFHLRVEVMINEDGNSGVYFRAPFGALTPQGLPTGGYEAQINSTHSDPNKTGSLSAPGKIAVSRKQSPVKCDDWFVLEVIADGPSIEVKVNGQRTASYVDAAPNPRTGQVALQVHNGATVVQFRKIEIKELPPGNLPLRWVHGRGLFEQVKGNVWLEQFHGNKRQFYREVGRTQDYVVLHRPDPQSKRVHCVHLHGPNCGYNIIGERNWTIPYRDGRWTVQQRPPPPAKSPGSRVGEWVPLFTGKDLTGWNRVAPPKMTWSAEGGELVGRASGLPGGGAVITHRADYDNFQLRLETMLSEGPISGLLLRCGPPQHGAGGNKSYLVIIGGTKQANKRSTGSLNLFSYAGTTEFAASLKVADADKVELKPGEWFPVEVHAEGNHLRVFVKGKKVLDYKDTNRTFSVGRVGLCCTANAVGRFRKVEIKELPTPEPAGRK